MKNPSLGNRTRRRLRQVVGACFGLFSVRHAKANRTPASSGCMTVIAGTRGIYFVPAERR